MKNKKCAYEQIKSYCRYRVSVAKKYRFVNFWTFVQLDLIDNKFARGNEIEELSILGEEKS